MTFRFYAVVAVGFALGVWGIGGAQACEVSGYRSHELDPLAVDGIAPAPPTVAVSNIRRGKGPETTAMGCGSSASSCDDLGSIALALTATDDQTEVAHMGFAVSLAEGSLPAGLTLPTAAIRTNSGYLFLHWGDGKTDDQEAFSFSLSIKAVDRAGNTSPETIVRVGDPGSGGGCSLLATRAASSWVVTTLGLIGLARLGRRWRRRA